MKKELSSDTVVIHDSARVSRRRFIRTGSAFVLAGGALAAVRPALADCDRGNTEEAAYDEDAGEEADAKCKPRDSDILSRHRKKSDNPIRVTRIVV